MVLPVYNYSTGATSLPDVGTLAYNGCTFSPLYETSLSCTAVKDNANRTVKYLEITLTADGYVTLQQATSTIGNQLFASSISQTAVNMSTALTAQGGQLTYRGRGFDMAVNTSGTTIPKFSGGGANIVTSDVMWGPVPELMEFQPLGGGLSAKVRWSVKLRIPNTAKGGANVTLLQFNCETVVTYGEDGYSSLSVKGTMEIPITRAPSQSTRNVTYTVDDYRSQLDTRIFEGIDLTVYRVVRRNYPISRDKRTLEFDVAVEELPYMNLPPYCTLARGSYSVKPSKAGMGLINWVCTLRATYTVRKDKPRRLAWLAFLALLRLRMSQSETADIPSMAGNQNPSPVQSAANSRGIGILGTVFDALGLSIAIIRGQNRVVNNSRKSWLIDFSFDEGLYLDSKSVTFSATWKLTVPFAYIIQASGLWTKVEEEDPQGRNLWATTMRNVQGSQSWLPNKLDPTLDVVVDFGS